MILHNLNDQKNWPKKLNEKINHGLDAAVWCDLYPRF